MTPAGDSGALLPLAWLDGRLLPAAEAVVPLLDHGFLYGDGLFETILVADGSPRRLDAHLDRLQSALAEIELPSPPRETLAEAVTQTVAANELEAGAVRLVVTRGSGPPLPVVEGVGPARVLVLARSFRPPGEAEFERGLSLCVGGRHPRPGRPGIKSLSYQPFLLALHEARARGFDEAVLLGDHYLVEACTANLFVVCGGALLTPDLKSGCLPGIVRAEVLRAAAAGGIRCEEMPLHWRILDTAAEIFLTSSLQGIMPVTRFQDRTPGGGSPGPVTRRLYRALVAQTARGLANE